MRISHDPTPPEEEEVKKKVVGAYMQAWWYSDHVSYLLPLFFGRNYQDSYPRGDPRAMTDTTLDPQKDQPLPLKPCPFCLGENFDTSNGKHVTCNNCYADVYKDV